MRKIILILVVLGLIYFGFSSLQKNSGEDTTDTTTIPTEDPMDVVINFYNTWLDAVHSTTTDPKAAGLYEAAVLSEAVKEYIAAAETTPLPNNLESVLCQQSTPERVGGKLIFKEDTKAEIQILSRGFETKSPYQAVVTLGAVNGAWQINKITCTQGEVAPEKEFAFEREGYLLKSVKPPLDPNFWHLVYEENGLKGHTVPLFFDESSVCIDKDGNEANCQPDTFTEPSLALLQADMIESGAIVKRLHFR